MRLLLPLVLVLATCWASDPQILDPLLNDVPPQLIQAESGNYRLPTDVRPLTYVIKLEPIFKKSNSNFFNFTGESVITLQVEKETNQIVFNSKNLDIINAVLIKPKENGTDKIPVEPVSNKTTELTTITLKDKITPLMKNIKLNLIYEGQLNDDLRGFYRSSYNKNNETR